MIYITKAEAKEMRKELPDAHIRRTAHKFYLEETPVALEVLRKIKDKKG